VVSEQYIGQNMLINYMISPNTRTKFNENSPGGSRCDSWGQTWWSW